MHLFEIISILLTSGVFMGVLALFYRFGRNPERTDNNFKLIIDRLNSVDHRLGTLEKDIQQLTTRITVVESKTSDI